MMYKVILRGKIVYMYRQYYEIAVHIHDDIQYIKMIVNEILRQRDSGKPEIKGCQAQAILPPVSQRRPR